VKKRLSVDFRCLRNYPISRGMGSGCALQGFKRAPTNNFGGGSQCLTSEPILVGYRLRSQGGAGMFLLWSQNPYCNTYSLSSPIVDRIVKEEGLKLLVKKLGLFDAQQFKGFDVVLCLGLLYHFRYPQLVLDYLSTLEMDWLFLSTQVHPGTSLFMFNRVDRRSHSQRIF
jgi:hypothetical protein